MRTLEYLISSLWAKGVYADCDFFCAILLLLDRVSKSPCFLLNSYYETTKTLKGDGSFWNTRAISAKNTVPLGSEKNTVAVVFLLSAIDCTCSTMSKS